MSTPENEFSWEPKRSDPLKDPTIRRIDEVLGQSDDQPQAYQDPPTEPILYQQMIQSTEDPFQTPKHLKAERRQGIVWESIWGTATVGSSYFTKELFDIEQYLAGTCTALFTVVAGAATSYYDFQRRDAGSRLKK